MKLYLFFIISFLTNVSLYSQTTMVDSVHHIGEVVVTGQPFEEVIPSQRLSGTQLQSLNSHSVADALRYFSGVQLKDYGGMGGLKTIDVRNMGSNHVGVFFDGVQLGNAQNGIVDLGKYSLDDIEEISMYHGQKSEIFQSAKDYSSASSIYIRSRKPKFVAGKNTNAVVRYKFGSIHLINPSIRIEQKLSRTFNMSLSGEYMKSGGEYKFRYTKKNVDGSIAYDTTAIRSNSDIEAYRLEAGLNGIVADGVLENRLYYYDSERGMPGPIVNNAFEHGGRLQDKNFFAQSRYTKQLTDRYKMRIQGKFAFDYTNHINYKQKYYQQEAYLSLVNMYSITSWWDASLSVDYQRNKLNSNKEIEFAEPVRHSVYASASSAIDLGRFKAQASVLSTVVMESVRYGKKNANQRKFTPAVFIGYQPFSGHNLNLRAFYKHIFRLPTFNDLYYAKEQEVNLRPELNHQYNVGFTYNKPIHSKVFRAFNMQVDAYYIDIKDKIIAVPSRNILGWSTVNKAKVRSMGVDAKFSMDAAVGKVALTTTVNYSYQDAKDVLNDRFNSTYKHQIPYAPKHSATGMLSANYDSWRLNYSYSYVGERYYSNNEPQFRLPAWHSHDVSIQKEIKLKYFTVKGAVEMNNALNQFHEVVRSYPLPGRNFKFILNIEI